MIGPRARLEEALQAAFDRLSPGADPVLRPSDHADFQANGALALARELGRPPSALAEALVASASLEEICSVEVSGPGFLNLTLSERYLADAVLEMANDVRLGVPLASTRSTVVVDYSGPNVAKEMHVGHLRTTIIGDSLCRMLAFADQEVIRENHLGDWGTPFGMLIEHLLDIGEHEAVEELSVGDLNTFYRAARHSFDSSESFQERSRRRVVALQSGDEETNRLWSVLVAESVAYFDQVYARLGVLLEDGDIVGESFYNALLPGVVADLDERGLLVESDGARCVFPPGFADRDNKPLPVIVQKRDGGYNYAATDLAAIRDRVDRLGAQTILYVVDAGQSQHFEMCFAVARLAGWLPEDVRALHVDFGIVLGPDRKRFRSRSGKTVKLVELLDEAVSRAREAMAARGASFEDEFEAGRLAASVGIGALKYADLSTDRSKDYVFDWDRMLAFEGNTGPYLQYAHARIASILRRAAQEGSTESTEAPMIVAFEEHALAVRLISFGEALDGALEGFAPSRLCQYLFELATTFTAFYEHCPVLRAADEATRASRLLLARVTADVLAKGLDLLGIDAPARM